MCCCKTSSVQSTPIKERKRKEPFVDADVKKKYSDSLVKLCRPVFACSSIIFNYCMAEVLICFLSQGNPTRYKYPLGIIWHSLLVGLCGMGCLLGLWWCWLQLIFPKLWVTCSNWAAQVKTQSTEPWSCFTAAAQRQHLRTTAVLPKNVVMMFHTNETVEVPS